MQKRSDLVIVSAFGRGNRLARVLASRGLHVSLVDVSDQLGRWTPDDWAGPFGYFFDEKIPGSDDVEHIELPRGLTVWMQDRPVEMRGPLSGFQLERLGMSAAAVKYLKESNLPGAAATRRDLERDGFDKTWLAHFAHQFSSNVYYDNFASLSMAHFCRPLLSRFSLRRTTRERIIHSFGECLNAGVSVFTSARIVDVSLVGGQLDAIEIASERSGVLTGRFFVWLLSSEESDVFPERVRTLFYPGGSIESSWCWVRFGFQLPKSFETDALPDHFVMMKDPHLPWTHVHCALAQRGLDPGRFNFWVRIPSKRRFQRSFLDDIGTQILAELKLRIPAVNAVLVERPPEYLVSHKELGAPRFQVFLAGHLRNLKRLVLKNLVYCGPEDWVSLDANGQDYSNQILQNHLIGLLTPQRKGSALDQPIHPT